MGVPTVVMGMPGARDDAAAPARLPPRGRDHRALARAGRPCSTAAQPWRAKTHAGRRDLALRRTPARRRPARTGGRVLVLSGRGGTELTLEHAGRRRARDAPTGTGRCSARPGPAGSTTRGRCCAPPTSSSPTPARTPIADVAAARRPAVVVPQPRPARRAATRPRVRCDDGAARRRPLGLAGARTTGPRCSTPPRELGGAGWERWSPGRAPSAPPRVLRGAGMRTAVITIVAGRHDHLVRQRAALDADRSTTSSSRWATARPSGAGGSSAARRRHRRRGASRTACRSPGPATPAPGTPWPRARSCSCSSTSTASPAADLARALPSGRGRTPPALLCGPVAYLPPRAAGRLSRRQGCTRSPTPHPARPVPPDDELERGGDHALFWTLSFAVTAATWRRVGGFCEDYVGYGGEDTDFGQLAARAGVDLCWVGGAWAYHQHHPTETPPVRHLADILRNAAIFHRRWGWWPMRAGSPRSPSAASPATTGH